MHGSLSVGYRKSLYPPTGISSSPTTRTETACVATSRFQNRRPTAASVPAKKATDVKPRNFVSSRRVTKRSSSAETGNSLDICNLLGHVLHDVEVEHVDVRRNHCVDLRSNHLLSELELVYRPFSPHASHLFGRSEEKRLAWANGCAHRF